MSLLSVIKETINTALTAVTETTAPKDAKKTNKKALPMVSDETKAKQKNEDTCEIKRKTPEAVYKRLENICAEFDLRMEDIKEAQLLESILGCPTEELATKSEEEITDGIKALRHTLSGRTHKLSGEKRNIDDLNQIAKDANTRIIYAETGRTFKDANARKKVSLEKELAKAGFKEVNEENIREYFHDFMKDAIASGNRKKIEKRYEQLYQLYGDLLIDTEDEEQRALLTAAIPQLDSPRRFRAGHLSIIRCGNNKHARQITARRIADNYEQITCTKDAFGKYTSQDDNIRMSKMSFQYMTEQDSMEVLENMKGRRKELARKIENGEQLTTDEAHYYEEVQPTQYSGAILGTVSNTEIESPKKIIGQINNDTEEFGIRDIVYSQTETFIDENPNEIPMSKEEFVKTMDEATDGEYSQTIEEVHQRERESESAKKSENKETETTETNTNTQNTAGVQEDAGNTSRHTYVNESKNSEKPAVKTETEVKEQPTSLEASSKNIPATSEEAIKGGVKSIKLFAKENKMSTFELAIDSLQTSNISSNTKKWAINEFKRVDTSLQKLKFNDISINYATDVAKVMDKDTLKELKFNSYEVKKSVERLEKENVK